MMHIAYPNILEPDEFIGCGRYRSLSLDHPPETLVPGYRRAEPHTGDIDHLLRAIEHFAPDYGMQHPPVYQQENGRDREYGGRSLELAYLLAGMHCMYRLREGIADRVGDIWCTGTIKEGGTTFLLGTVEPETFGHKLNAFLASPQDPYKSARSPDETLFFIPARNFARTPVYEDRCQRAAAVVCSVQEFQHRVSSVPDWYHLKTVVKVRDRELADLIDILFDRPHQQTPRMHSRSISRDPYKGLDSFRVEDADLFFGRDQELQQLQSRVAAVRLLILHGESGTGKTSLLHAGLLAQLPPESYAWVSVRALQELTQSLQEAMIRELGLDRQALRLPLLDFLHMATAALGRTVVVVLDQFEEFFLQHDLPVRRAFHRQLGACVTAARLDVHFIIAIRDEYFARLAEFEETIPEVFRHQMRLRRLNVKQGFDAMVKPAQYLGLTIDETHIREVCLPRLDLQGQGIEPPVLQLVCSALYAHSRTTGSATIGYGEYAAIGDPEQVLKHYLDSTLKQFGQEQQPVQAVLKALVTSQGTKQAGFAKDILARVQSFGVHMDEARLESYLLRRLVQTRLVRVEDVEGRARYELIHDFLASRIKGWITESEEKITKVLELIERAYESYRATGVSLSWEALKWIAAHQAALVLPLELSRFVETSQRRAIKERREGWLKVGTLLLVVALGVGGMFSWRLYQNYKQLEIEKTRAEASAIETEVTVATLYREQGRQALLDGRLLRAAVYLSKAYQQGPEGGTRPILRMLLAQAMRSVDTQLATLAGHTSWISSAVFSPDSTRVVTASHDGTARLWDAHQGDLLATLTGHDDRVASAVFSPDGTQVVTASEDKTARLWDAHQGDLLATLTGHDDRVASAVFSPDGTRVVTASHDGTARLWDAHQGDLLATLTGHDDRVASAVFSPDGTQVVTASEDKTARVWDAWKGDLLATLTGHTTGISVAAFSPDGTKILTASEDYVGPARVWDAQQGRLLVTLTGHTGRISEAAFSPDGTRVVTVEDRTAHVWDTHQGHLLATLAGHTSWISSAVFSPDGTRAVTASHDGTVRLWDAQRGHLFAVLEGHTAGVSAAAFSPDGTRVVTVSDDWTARVWDAQQSSLLVTLTGHTASLDSAVFSSDSTRVVTASADRTARIWDAQRGRLLATLKGHAKKVRSAVFSPDGIRVVTASEDGTARIWDAQQGRLLATLKSLAKTSFPFNFVTSAVFSPDGTRVVTAGGEAAQVWDATQGRLLSTLGDPTDLILSTAFSPDGTRMVARSSKDQVQVWDTVQSRFLFNITGHANSSVWSVAFDPSGTRIVTASEDQTAKVWDATQGNLLVSFTDHTNNVWSAAFSPDGTRVVTASDDGTAKVWDATQGNLLVSFTDHSGRVRSAAFSPDGTRIVTANDDGTAKVWAVRLETRTPSEIASLVRCRALWRLEAGVLLPTTPDPTACPRP